MNERVQTLETKRIALQERLDGNKSAEERNRMGQFATPTHLACDILRHGLGLLPKSEAIRFLDPGIGTGSFYSALNATVSAGQIESAVGFEVDPYYGEPARKLWDGTQLKIRLKDFTSAEPAGRKANLVICNPPYVRHHHLDTETKVRLQSRTQAASGVKINGLSGLYCYFMGLSHPWMAKGAIAGWLIPSEFMSVNYGRMLKAYLLKKVTLLHIHRFDPNDVQFADALVSSAIVWIRNAPPPKDHAVRFTYGGTLKKPVLDRLVPACDLLKEAKWTRYPQADAISAKFDTTLEDFFDIKRGIVTGGNSFFIMDRARLEELDLPIEMFRPVLPGSRHIPTDEIKADANGLPLLDKQLFLLDPRLNEEEIAQRYPMLLTYLKTGMCGTQPVAKRYLCRTRKPWYAQENRPPAPLICTYMGRYSKDGKPFRFILNHSRATACNTYLMLYPKPVLARLIDNDPKVLRAIWAFLNKIETADLLKHGRVYGGGLYKLEPKELRGYPAEELLKSLPNLGMGRQGNLL